MDNKWLQLQLHMKFSMLNYPSAFNAISLNDHKKSLKIFSNLSPVENHNSLSLSTRHLSVQIFITFLFSPHRALVLTAISI